MKRVYNRRKYMEEIREFKEYKGENKKI